MFYVVVTVSRGGVPAFVEKRCTFSGRKVNIFGSLLYRRRSFYVSLVPKIKLSWVLHWMGLACLYGNVCFKGISLLFCIHFKTVYGCNLNYRISCIGKQNNHIFGLLTEIATLTAVRESENKSVNHLMFWL